MCWIKLGNKGKTPSIRTWLKQSQTEVMRSGGQSSSGGLTSEDRRGAGKVRGRNMMPTPKSKQNQD
uniref:Uncharacterized protein n=1 Tax=Oryza brachyantha TaxID=4533 RepID=J3MFS1_ORYBR